MDIANQAPKGFLERTFKLSEHNTDVKTEVLAGITTFMTMAYILVVNPMILADAGMDKGAVFVATALAAAIATFVMGFLANYPFALAPGMGLNAFFAYTVVLGMGYTWQFALMAVFIEGIIFKSLMRLKSLGLTNSQYSIIVLLSLISFCLLIFSKMSREVLTALSPTALMLN